MENSLDLRIAGVVKESIVDGPGIRFVIFTQGCPHNCKGCHNPESHDFNGGYIIKTKKIIDEIKKNPLLKGVTFSGGEPFLQPEPLLQIAEEIKKLSLDCIIYSGFRFEELIKKSEKDNNILRLLKACDYLVDGKFVEDLKSIELRFRGSSNQRIIDLKKSFKNNYVVESDL